MARPARFELTAFGSGGQRSIQLGYGRTFFYVVFCRRAVKPQARRAAADKAAAFGYTVPMARQRNILVGVSGASGMPLALHLLRLLGAREDVCTHGIITRAAEAVLRAEGGLSVAELAAAVQVLHAPENMAAPPASGSWQHAGMVIVPCSMNTLGALAAGQTANLLQRAADVCLKERRPLVLVTRESPLSRIHLRNMLTLHEAGAVIMPFSPAFYLHPRTLDELLDQFCGRILDQLHLDHALGRWGGSACPAASSP